MSAMFTETAAPTDEAPPVADDQIDLDLITYPDATPEAPYGYTPTGRIRKRPVGSRAGGAKGAGRGSMPASRQQAETAAALLARANGLVGLSLAMFGMPLTATALADANNDFQNMATEALLADPSLCRKILSAGATSGKAGLVMAYAMLGVSVAPAMMGEIKDKRVIEGEVVENASHVV